MRKVKKAATVKQYYESHIGQRARTCLFVLGLLTATSSSFAQAASTAQTPQTQGAPLTITLQDALQRASTNDPQYRSAITDLGLAREDRVQARAGLLPDVNYNNSFIYTQGTGPRPADCSTSVLGCLPSGSSLITAVHEYVSQADVHQALSLTTLADYRRSAAALAWPGPRRKSPSGGWW